MVRSLIRLGLTLAGNAIGLLIASLVLDDLHITGAAFVVAVVIFTVLMVVLQPLMTKLALQHAESLQGGSALVTTFLALLITSLVSDGLQIDGVVTWLLATVIVWLGALLAGVVLPMIFLKDAIEDRK
ncbi:MAG: phage holin family protein [Ilumatobacteraceae bacterium]